MPTRDVMLTINARIRRDRGFRELVLARAFRLCNSEEVDLGKATLRNYISATIGYEELGKKLKTSPQSIRGMLNARGYPRAHNLSDLVNELQKATDVRPVVNGAEPCSRKREI